MRDRFVKNNISANLNGDNIQNIQNSGKINGNININQINKKDWKMVLGKNLTLSQGENSVSLQNKGEITGNVNIGLSFS